MMKKPAFILTDIEGTTTSISFVSDELFPYFRNEINELLLMTANPLIQTAFEETKTLALELDDEKLETNLEIIAKLYQWSVEDRKITPLKTLQGILWNKGYQDGTLKGHVYDDVAQALKSWQQQGIGMGVFSSGSVAAQKLIFGYSIAGDLTPFFSAYFDTKTGGKREENTYKLITDELKVEAAECLFLSDIKEELEAADAAGMMTVQLVRPGTIPTWKYQVADFTELQFEA